MTSRRKIIRALTRDGQDGPLELGAALAGGAIAAGVKVAIIVLVAVMMGVWP
ncbi:hypothetical protein [Sphingopyxis sp. GW247-27LB]|uniref:hypothetical protein n=1 Tax=Sphingopyxis sp. GW247-27LB TaxID=2012632 RepID=UPI001595DECF|nr:hypothetical protein [Sphingopyxis sp. GW247-27LB]